MFIYCLDEQTKDKLIAQGYQFIKVVEFAGKQTWLFDGRNLDCSKLDFDKSKVIISNKLNF